MRKKPLHLLKKRSINRLPIPYLIQCIAINSDTYQLKKSYQYTNIKRKEASGVFIRPLLNCSRSLVTRVCKHENFPIYPDKSNQAVLYSRNRIRKQILPSIKIFCNPQVEDAIFRFSEHIIQEQDLISIFFPPTF